MYLLPRVPVIKHCGCVCRRWEVENLLGSEVQPPRGEGDHLQPRPLAQEASQGGVGAEEGWETCGSHSYLRYLWLKLCQHCPASRAKGRVGAEPGLTSHSHLPLSCIIVSVLETGVEGSLPAEAGDVQATAAGHREPSGI